MSAKKLKELGRMIKAKRERENLSLRDLENLIYVSSSSLSRFERGVGSPDFDTLAKLAEWLDVPVERFVADEEEKSGQVTNYIDKPLPEIIREFLMKDKNLTPSNAARLAAIFQVSYEQFIDKTIRERNVR